jgi:membrane-associated phospholipid phosphatase
LRRETRVMRFAAWPATVGEVSPLPVAGRRRALAQAAAAACSVGLVATGVLGLAVDAGRAGDAAILHGFTGLDGSRVHSGIKTIAVLADPVPYLLIGSACIGVALTRRRAWRALATATVLVGSAATTHALKHLIPQARYQDWLFGDQTRASWPSGHATAAMTLALCAVMVAGPAWRAASALAGGAYAVGLTYATLALTWHYPSDMLAGFFVAGLWISLALVVLSRLEGDHSRGDPLRRLVGLSAVGATGALIATAIVGVASGRAPVDAAERASAAAGALAIAALALALLVMTLIAAAEPETDPGNNAASPRIFRRRIAS